MIEPAGYLEVEHTADWELQVWAPDLACLFEQAARGMLALSGVELAVAPRIERRFTLQAGDREGLLVGFLAELLYIMETDAIGFDEYELTPNGSTLQAVVRGAPLLRVEKEIKAVTYHNLVIHADGSGLRVNLIFDV